MQQERARQIAPCQSQDTAIPHFGTLLMSHARSVFSAHLFGPAHEVEMQGNTNLEQDAG